MNINKKIVSIVSTMLILPIKTFAFINLCVPISLTVLIILLSWPNIVVHKFYEISSYTHIFVIGFIVDILLAIFIGFIVDLDFKVRKLAPKQFYYKLPLIFLSIIIILFLISIVDKSCWGI